MSEPGALAERATVEIMEAMFFCAVEPDPALSVWERPDLVWARLRLDSPFVGEMLMTAPSDATLEWAQLAWPDMLPEQVEELVLQELINAVGGIVEGAWSSDDAPHIGLPESGKGALPCDLSEWVQLAFLADHWPLGVAIRPSA